MLPKHLRDNLDARLPKESRIDPRCYCGHTRGNHNDEGMCPLSAIAYQYARFPGDDYCKCEGFIAESSHEQPASAAGSETDKHPFIESPSSSVTCLTCGARPSDSSHANVPAPAAPETGEEWLLSVDGLTVFRAPTQNIGYVPLMRSSYEKWQESDPKTWPAKAEAQAIMRKVVKEHNSHHSLVEALKGVAIMLNTELEGYEQEPWAQRVRAALATIDQKGSEK